MQVDTAFDASIIKEIDMMYRDYVIQGARSSSAEIRLVAPGTPIPAPGGDPEPRRAKLEPQEFERRGFTIDCLGCEQIQLGSPNRKNHTEACRNMIDIDLGKTSEGQDRLDHAKDRLDTGGGHRLSRT